MNGAGFPIARLGREPPGGSSSQVALCILKILFSKQVSAISYVRKITCTLEIRPLAVSSSVQSTCCTTTYAVVRRECERRCDDVRDGRCGEGIGRCSDGAGR